MRGVGPAGRRFIVLKERGRRIVVSSGGRRSVGGRMLIRKDYVYMGQMSREYKTMRTHSEFARAPKTLNNAEVVDDHCCKEEFGRIYITEL